MAILSNVISFIVLCMGPVPLLRLELACGGVGFCYGVVSSIIFNISVIFILPINPIFKIICIIVSTSYCISAIIFFLVINEKYRQTFYYTANWLTCLRRDIWNHPYHSSSNKTNILNFTF